MKKYLAFTLMEISVVAVLVLLTALLIIPNLIEDNKKLDIISKWKNAYQNIEYVFSALRVQFTEVDNKSFQVAQNDEEKEHVLYELLTPYLRMEEPVSVENYKTYYLNGLPVNKNDVYYMKCLHLSDSGQVIGLKWLNTPKSLSDKFPVAMMSYDLNGIKKPNKWGYDIFGINIYTDSIEPIGKSDDDYLLRTDCSKKGQGISCSYYYYIYGGKLN